MRIPSFCNKFISVLFFSTYFFSFNYAQTSFSRTSIDTDLLNKHVLEEVNKLRKKEKVSNLQIEMALFSASDDHARYMLLKEKLTHKQKNRLKKTAKNRVDFYGQQFNLVGENIQLNNLNLNAVSSDKKNLRIDTYEKLAEQLVLTWKNSPLHFANMINSDFLTTFCSIAVSPSGEIYACQVFGGSKYVDKYMKFRDSVEFKPDRPSRCWRCHIRPPAGIITVAADSTIIFHHDQPRFFFNLFLVPSILSSRMRFFNPLSDGLAADIIVKSQYPCDSNSYHNGLSNFRGVPLKPVYKKDFNGGIHLGHTEITLGKVPKYINEEFEVNLVVIQNKRPCSNTMFNIIPSDFHVEIPLSYGFEPLETKKKSNKLDTLYRRMYFDQSMIVPRDTSLSELKQFVRVNIGKIQKIDISGFASIEGSTEGNTQLYLKRSNFLVKELKAFGIDSTQIQIQTAENFRDFRKDIKSTKFAYLDTLSDSDLKKQILNIELSTQLEFLLKNHRYADIRITTRDDFELEYDQSLVNQQLKDAIDKGNIQKCIDLQRIQFGLILAGKMAINNMEEIVIPVDSKNMKLLHNKAVMKNYFEPQTTESLKAFRADLWEIRSLKEEDKLLNTSIAIIDFYLYTMGQYHYKKVSFFDSIQKWKNIDEVQKARILLNTSTAHDWGYWQTTGSTNQKKYWFKKVKRYVAPAKLDIDKTFEVASYFAFFWQEKYAFELTKGKIDETENPNDLIFFLKLVHLTNVELPRDTYLRYFKKIKKYAREDFCTFFNNPALNFQILDDEEIKRIYCAECNDHK